MNYVFEIKSRTVNYLLEERQFAQAKCYLDQYRELLSDNDAKELYERIKLKAKEQFVQLETLINQLN